MNALARLLGLSAIEKETRGLVHTPREILQQPTTWGRTYKTFLQLTPSLGEFLLEAGLGVSSRNLSVFLIGAGTSDYIGKSVGLLIQKQWGCDVRVTPSTDLLTNMEDYVLPERSYLWVSFSRSGDSSEGVAVLNRALERYPKVCHLIVTCNVAGQMASSFEDDKRVFRIVLDDEVNDRGLAMTSSFSNMVIVGQALAHLRDPETYRRLLDDLSDAASQVLPEVADTCERLVSEGFSKVCFLGTGSLKGAATESALKVLELTDGRVVSFAESFLGLRHGPLSAVDCNTLVVGFLSGVPGRQAYELDLLKEISDKQLTKKFLGVMPGIRRDSSPVSFLDNRILLSFRHQIADLHRPPVDVLIGQLLGLFASLREGLKPDTPSPLGAINRVVSNVLIH